MIQKLIKPSYIRLGVEATDWQDAIFQSAQPLIDSGAIAQSYVDGIISVTKEFGPYFVIAKGIALPHCSNNGNVFETSLSITVLKKAVVFGHEQNDPVKYIFVLAPKTTDDHINGLAQLVNLLTVDEFYTILEKSTNALEVYDYIVEKENEEK